MLAECVELEIFLVGEQLVVKLPELALLLGCDRRGVGRRGILVNTEGKVLPDNLDAVAVDLLDLLEGRTDPRAIRSLEIRKLGDSNGGTGRTLGGRPGSLDLIDTVGIGSASGRLGSRPGGDIVHLGGDLADPVIDLAQSVVQAHLDAVNLTLV